MSQNKTELKRQLGAGSLAINSINLTVGAGIFVLPALVASNLGSASFIAYLLCGLLVILIMLCFAEVGSKVTAPGGAYAYVEKAFGPFAGFIINTLFWFGFAALADAAILNAMTDMLAKWYPSLLNNYIRIPFFIVLYSLMAFINIRGVKEGASFALIATILKLAPLILLIVLGLFKIDTDNLVVSSLPSFKNIGETTLLLFFAFVGTEAALSISGEIKNPKRSIPKGIFMGIFGILMIYMLIQLVAQGVMGDQLPNFKDAPLAALANQIMGPIGGKLILVTAVVSIFGVLSGDILATPRIIYAASRDKLLPSFLSNIHPKFNTPYWSIILYSIVILVFASSGGFKQLAVLASSSVLIIYLAVVLATIKLRFQKRNNEEGSFKIKGGLFIPIMAIATILWLLLQITFKEVLALSIFFVMLTAFYFINKSIKKNNH